jgi:hypothetical protein
MSQQLLPTLPGKKNNHRQRTFDDELREFIERHGLRWQEEKSR